jgi:hypothetical protein
MYVHSHYQFKNRNASTTTHTLAEIRTHDLMIRRQLFKPPLHAAQASGNSYLSHWQQTCKNWFTMVGFVKNDYAQLYLLTYVHTYLHT